MGRIERLLKHQDVDGLIKRLDKKDAGEASIALTVLGAAAVPALVEELDGPDDKAAAATNVLINIGAPALLRLAVVLGTERYGMYAGVAIAGIRKRGIPLTDECLKELRACADACDPSKAAERREAHTRLGMAADKIDELEAKESRCYIAVAQAMGELAVEDGKLVLA